MKKFFTRILFLFLIVVGVWWFVNSGRTSIAFFHSENRNSTTRVDVFGSDNNQDNLSSWQFAVIGDTEDVGPITQKFIDDISQRDIDFVVHVGDVSSDSDEEGMREVVELFATLPFPTYYVPGNNDLAYDSTIERKTLEVYKNVFGEDVYSSLDHKNGHIVLLDNSYRRIGFSDEELEWLKRDLGENKQDYTFLFFHRPLDVPGQELIGDDETTTSRIQNEKFKELLNNYGIDHIFNGHVHSTLSYTLNTIPVTITGGGGALPQAILGGADAAFYHYYIVKVFEAKSTTTAAQLPEHELELVRIQ